jgi:hypothetical protein
LHWVRNAISSQSMLFDGLRLRPALFGLLLLLSFPPTRIFQSMLSGTRRLDPWFSPA